MATTTTNYGLTKPDVGEPIDISVLNENMDKVDKQMKLNAEAIPPVATTKSAGIVKPDGTTVTVDEDGTIHGAQTYELPTADASTLGGVKIGKNLTMSSDGKLNAYADFNKDEVPTDGSTNVPTSGGTYTAINNVDKKVEGIRSQVTALTTGIIWKNAVDTFASIATAYPSPETGWTVMCLDTGNAYHWNGTEWISIFVLLIPVASAADVKAVLEGQI